MPLIDNPSCDLVLYTHPWSRGRTARWVLEEAGVPYRHVMLDWGDTGVKAPEYLALNSMGKVPTLVHQGKVITECAAICTYIADAFPQAELAPAVAARADYYRWLFFAAGPFEAAMMDRHLKVEITAEQQSMMGYGTYEHAEAAMVMAVEAHPYITGERFSVADAYVGALLMWGMQFGLITKRPAFESYTARLMARPAYQAARAIDDALAAALKSAKV